MYNMIKKFTDWLNEDFAAVGVAPAGNVQGMGDAVPPTATSTGSGDLWPSLGAPASLAKLKKSKRTKSPKRNRRKEKMLMKNSLQESNGPAFSIRDTKVGDVVSVDGKDVQITKFLSWVKNSEAACISFEGTMVDTGDPVTVKYSDAHDGYIFEGVDPIVWSGGDVARMPIIGKVTTKAIGPFEESDYDVVEIIKDPKGKDVYIANFWYKRGVPQLIHSELVKEYVPVTNENEGPSITKTVGYPSKVVVSGPTTEKHQDAIIKAIQEADPSCKGLNAPKPMYYPATGKVVGIMDSTCLRALSVALRRVDSELKAEIKK